MPYKKKLVPETANNVTKYIINMLKIDGHCAARINNAAVYDPIKKVFRKTRTGQNGVADILACMRPYDSANAAGRFVAFEIKIGKDRQSAAQKGYQKQVEEANGEYVVIKSASDFTDWYRKFCGNA